MTIRERLGLGGLALVGIGALLATFVVRPLVEPASAADGDGDGLSDTFEAAYGTNAGLTDSDGDGLSDWTEIFVTGTDPNNNDTDGDGTHDAMDATPLNDGTDADGRSAATSTWAENLTAPAWTGTSVKDGKSVYPHSGEFTHSLELLRIDPGYGPSMDLTISYRSGISYDGPVGNNWSWLPGVKELVNHDIEYRPGDGHVYDYTYHHPGAPDPDFWTPPPDGVFWPSMVKNIGGTYTLLSIRGDERNFATTGDIATVKDRFGNTVIYTYTLGQLTSIADATGHQVTVAWYGTGRVQTLTDDDGRVVTLTYNCNGQLAKVTTPTSTAFASGRTYQFVYSSGSGTTTLNDNMVRAKDPKGQLWLRNEFDASDRITKQYLGADYFTFAYNGGGVTEVYDREGNKREWTISGVVPTTLTEYSNRNVRGADYGNDDPSTWVTTFTHDATTQQRTNIVYPNGNRVDTDYDGSGCPTEIRRKTTDTNSDSNTNDIYESFAYDSTAGKYHLMTSHTDERGNTTTYVLDAAKAAVTTVGHPTVTYPSPDQTVAETLTWNAYGQLVTMTDSEGFDRTNIYNHDESDTTITKGYLKKVVVDDGGLDLTTEYTYTNWGSRTSVTNPRGFTTTITVDEFGWVLGTVTDSPQGYELLNTYDANGNVHFKDVENVNSSNSRDGSNPWFRTTYNFDVLDNLTSRVEEIDVSHTRTWGFTYTKNERLLTLSKPESNQTRHVYDERDLIYTRTRGYGSGDASTDKSYFDGNRNRIKWTNGRAKSWTREYDLFDRNTVATNPLGHYAETIYDKSSNVAEAKRWEDNGGGDVLLSHTKQSFDEMGRMYKVERGLKGVSTWTFLATTLYFDERSLVTQVVDPRGKTTDFTYDGAGRRDLVEDALGNQVATTYDENGNPTLVEEIETTGHGSPTTYETEKDYDELDRLSEKRVVDETNGSNKHTTTYAYDSLNVLVSQVDAESNTTTWTHDGLARKLEESIDLGSSAYKKRTWAYDKNDRMTSHKDDGNNETTWAWNARDLVTTETYPDTGTKVFDYDAADNVEEWTDPMGTVVTLTWDDNNRNTVRAIALGTDVGGTEDETYTYDALDRLTEGQDDDTTVQMTWDSLSRKKTEKSGPNPMSTYGKTTSYTYDDAGNVTQIDYPDGSFAAKRTVDDVNRVTLVEDGSNVDIVAVDYYGAGGRLKKLTFGNTTYSNYGYDGFRWVSDLDHKTSTPTTFAGYDMVYDKVGNLLYEEWSHDSGKGNNYSYDKAYRLTETLQGCADPSAEFATPTSQTYVKKLAYNLTDDSDRSSVVTTLYGISPTTSSYTSNNVHEYTVVGGVNRTYDDAGNLTDDGTFEYAYDYRNQLLTATRKSNAHVEGTYEYDVLGRRTKKTLYDTSSARYYHDGLHEIEEYDGSGNVLRKYVYRQDIDSIAMMEAKDVADVDNDANTTELVRLFYHYDSRNNVARITAAAQTVVEAYEYDPFGNVSIKDKSGGGVSSTQVGNPFDFQKRRRDIETGLMYFRARMYDPMAGHWLQRDPLGFTPGPNWREFTASNPLTNVDPLGLKLKRMDEPEDGSDPMPAEDEEDDDGCVDVVDEGDPPPPKNNNPDYGTNPDGSPYQGPMGHNPTWSPAPGCGMTNERQVKFLVRFTFLSLEAVQEALDALKDWSEN